MNNPADKSSHVFSPAAAMQKVQAGLGRRYRAERRFRLFGKAAIFIGLLFLSFLFISIISKGYTAFQQTWIELEISP